jgi:hypothetical protein
MDMAFLLSLRTTLSLVMVREGGPSTSSFVQRNQTRGSSAFAEDDDRVGCATSAKR